MQDLAKVSEAKVPEAMGLVVGCVLVVTIILFHPWFPSLALFNAATTAITLTVLTGFMDDVLDLRWKTKIGLSFLAALPLLVAYNGPTNVIVPKPLRDVLGLSVELSLLYHCYMLLLAVFFTNSINIYAGVNGLEVGQTGARTHEDGRFIDLTVVLSLPQWSSLHRWWCTTPCSWALRHATWKPLSFHWL